MNITKEQIASLNKDIELIQQMNPKAYLFKITEDMCITHSGVSRLVFMDRYTFKDLAKITIKGNDIVVLTIKNDPQFPARGIGVIQEIEGKNAVVKVFDEYAGAIPEEEANEDNLITRSLDDIDKPLEIFYEQVAKRNAKGLSMVEPDVISQSIAFEDFYSELVQMNIVPAGRVLYGAGAGTDVTYFNCYVMPMPKDSRGGIGDHRNEVMEIMSRGGKL